MTPAIAHSSSFVASSAFYTSSQTTQLQTLDSNSTQADLPAAIPTGTVDYYRERNADFMRRNPGMTPPDYYMQYGDKYSQRFASLTRKDLSSQGLKWRDKTLKALQDAMEAKRAADPVGFAELERNPNKFKDFVYGTHTDAYIESGLFELPIRDIITIAHTPDIGDVFSLPSLRPTLLLLSKLTPLDILAIGTASLKDLFHLEPYRFSSINPDASSSKAPVINALSVEKFNALYMNAA